MGDKERIDDMEEKIDKIRKKVDEMDINTKRMQVEIGELKEKVLSIESNMRELVEIFRILSKRIEEGKERGEIK